MGVKTQCQLLLVNMGCSSSKTNATKPAEAPTKATLLDDSVEKAAVEAPVDAATAPTSFSMFVDSIGVSRCLAVAENGAMLRVEDVEGGPIGLWNNRPRTEKVKMGDFVVKVRKAGASEAQWIAD